MTAGYSTRPLSEKLGIKKDFQIVLLNPPENYGHLLHPIPEGSSVYDFLQSRSDLIQVFTKQKTELENFFPKLKQSLKQDGSLWISWPKGTSKLETDLNENIIREIGLENGLVDVKVIAVDEDWSGLKFVYRIKDRK